MYSIIKDHQGFEQLINIEVREQELIIAVEYLEVNLDMVFSQERYHKVSENLAKVYLYQILKSVTLIHNKLIIHNSISLSNLKITNKGHLKLSGFEKSQCLQYKSNTIEDSDEYQSKLLANIDLSDMYNLAPEIILGQDFQTFATDMWAVGCVFFNLVSGFHPFKESCMTTMLYRIFKTLGTPNMNILEFPTLTQCPYFVKNYDKFPVWQSLDFSALIPDLAIEGIDLLRKMLEIEPEKRISAINALKHPFFNNLNEELILD
ncbi:cyclin-dependent kinase 3 [Stylonychia lemnae]|uniref:Cyclin-dependent kinase 3 n=1 Tax=Stylonychia lemnae TaxID=5949 RepID=A0A078AXU0_STYLE|nr:cyclin-dependent kinase 3 [Stylonychia lemnae]|eukprot:CDW86994.1 cyclin-dependent kinase 3 [Stylonychia lemnae]